MYSSGNVELSASDDVMVITPAVSTTVHLPACGVVPVTFTNTKELGETLASVITHVFAVLPHKTVAGDLYLAHPS